MRRLVPALLLASAVSAALVLLDMTPAGAASQQTAPAGPVSSTPGDTPELYGSDNPPQQVRQLVQCGGTMYAVGTINEIRHNSTNYTRSNVFSFSATSPYDVTSWAPSVNGTVNSIAFNGTNCADAYIGGTFSSVNGTKVANIAEIDTTVGNVVATFGHSANSEVDTLLGVDGHILAGGAFTTINGSTTDRYMASLNPATGADDGFVKLNISGHYQYACSGAGCANGEVSSNGTKVFNQALSHGGTLDLVMGDFTSVGGLPRQQIFMLNLATTPASVTAWTSPEWDGSQGMQEPGGKTGYPYECAGNEPFYIRAAAWSPGDSTVYIATTGYHPNGWPVGATQRTGLCDAAAAFPATQGVVLHDWVNYTGCDSYYSAAADANDVYVAGHERWANNPNDCDAPGPGAIFVQGFAGLSPTTGQLSFNPTRARGFGADDMLLTTAGLWIASDNMNGATRCAGKADHAGICFLPYAS
jgi:hypothetical protein